jgi:putative membrane protein
MCILRPLPALFFLALAAAGAHAQPRPPSYAASAAAEAKPLSNAQRLERRFLQITAANMRFEADGSRIAPTRSNNAAVKDIAKAVATRQKTAQPELLHLLQARGMAMPILTNDHTKVLKQLGKVNGAKFDRLYVEDVVLRSYQADIENFEKMALEAEDPVLKAWVERQLPVLRTQLSNANRALPSASLRGQRAV